MFLTNFLGRGTADTLEGVSRGVSALAGAGEAAKRSVVMGQAARRIRPAG
jgi:hypothetical protein